MPANPRHRGRPTAAAAFVVKVMRVARGLKVGQFAAEAHISPSTFEKIEARTSKIDLEQLFRIAEAFGIAPDELIAAVNSETKLDKEARMRMAARAIELAGADPTAIADPKIQRLLEPPPSA